MISSQGVVALWGGRSLGTVTSLSTSQSIGDVEITSMSSLVLIDPENTNRRLVVRDFDAGDMGATDVSIEFLASTTNFAVTGSTAFVGLVKNLSLTMPADQIGTGTSVGFTATALLTQLSLSASAGDYVRGSATFRLSGIR